MLLLLLLLLLNWQHGSCPRPPPGHPWGCTPGVVNANAANSLLWWGCSKRNHLPHDPRVQELFLRSLGSAAVPRSHSSLFVDTAAAGVTRTCMVVSGAKGWMASRADALTGPRITWPSCRPGLLDPALALGKLRNRVGCSTENVAKERRSNSIQKQVQVLLP